MYMRKQSKKNKNNYPVPHVYDLFGDIPVTKNEIVLWVETVARLPADSPRFEWYVKNWYVVDKIKRVKLQNITLDAYFLASAANDAH